MKDKEWATLVKERDGFKCCVCNKEHLKTYPNKKGEPKRCIINAHHIIPKEFKPLRHDLDNGISLCQSHHRFSRRISAHQNSIEFFLWLLLNKRRQLNTIIKKWDYLKPKEDY